MIDLIALNHTIPLQTAAIGAGSMRGQVLRHSGHPHRIRAHRHQGTTGFPNYSSTNLIFY